MRRLIILFLFIVLFSQFVLPIENDFELTIALDNEIYTRIEYDKLYKIKNLDWSQDRTESDITVNYYFLDDYDDLLLDESGEPVLDDYTYITGLKSSKTSKTGTLYLEQPGDYYFCAEITETSLDDPYEDNDLDCKEITVIDIDDVTVYNDFKVSIALDDTIFSLLDYYDPFKVENLDWNYYKMESDIRVDYYIYDQDKNLIFEDYNDIEAMKSSKKSDTGEIYIEDEGTYTICAEITSTSIEDDNEDNNLECKQIEVVDSSNIKCNMTINIDSEDFFYSDETVDFDFIIQGEEYFPEVEYWIEDLFDYVVQDPVEIDTDYSGDILKYNIGDVYDYRNFIIKANITDPWCDDSDYGDNYAQKMIVVINPKYYTFPEYEIDPYIAMEIKKEGTINFGKTFFINLEVWSGDSSGKLKIWVEENGTGKVASESTITLGVPEMTYLEDLEIPIGLKDNCDRKLKDGNYSIFVEGFGFKDNAYLDIGGVNNKICREDNSKEESTLEIDSIHYKSGSSAKLGETMGVNVKAYKGNTGKSVLKAYIKDDKDQKISSYDSKFTLKTKYQSYELTIPIQLKPLCGEKTENREYTLVVEGLDLRQEQKIDIDGETPSLCKYSSDDKKTTTTSKKNTFTSQIYTMPDKVKQGELFYVDLQFTNTKDQDIEISAWSYLADGSKILTDKDPNKQVLVVDKDDSSIMKLINKVPEDLEPGEYQLKVAIDRSDIKTNNYLTQNILVDSNEQNNTCIIYQTYEAKDDNLLDSEQVVSSTSSLVNQGNKEYSYKYDQDIDSVKPVTGSVIYESSTVKANKLVPYFIILTLLALTISLIFYRI